MLLKGGGKWIVKVLLKKVLTNLNESLVSVNSSGGGGGGPAFWGLPKQLYSR
jgi:hypothetical protein